MSRPHYSVVTAPTIEAITVAQASDHVRVDSTADQEYIAALIPVGRQYVEDMTGKVCSRATFRVVAASWSDLGGLTLPIMRAPLVAVTSVKYYASGSTTQTTMDTADYTVCTATEPGSITIATAPAVATRPDAIEIVFTAGPERPEQSPPALRHAIKMMVAHLYEERAPVSVQELKEIPHSLHALIETQRIGGRVA